MQGEIAATGITWEAVGMTVTIIATLGLPMMYWIWMFGRKTGSMDSKLEQLDEKDGDLEKRIDGQGEEIQKLLDKMAERDRRLYDKLDEMNKSVSQANIGIAEIRGYELGKKQGN